MGFEDFDKIWNDNISQKDYVINKNLRVKDVKANSDGSYEIKAEATNPFDHSKSSVNLVIDKDGKPELPDYILNDNAVNVPKKSMYEQREEILAHFNPQFPEPDAIADQSVDPTPDMDADADVGEEQAQDLEQGEESDLALANIEVNEPAPAPAPAVKSKKAPTQRKKTAVVEDDFANEFKDEDVSQEALEEEVIEAGPQEELEEKLEKVKNPKDKKAPNQELMEDLGSFVANVNQKITDFAKSIGQKAWDKIQDTPAMKALNNAMGEAKEFLNDKIDKQLDAIKNSSVATSAKGFIDTMKDKIGSSLDAVTSTLGDSVTLGASIISDSISKAKTKTSKAKEEPAPVELSQVADTLSITNIIEKFNEKVLGPVIAQNDKAVTSTLAKTQAPQEPENQQHVSTPGLK
jgi:hypothetical protein